jgi:hypothetical protein
MVARRNHSMFNQHEKYDIVVLGKSSGFWEKMFINSYLFNSFSIQHYVIKFCQWLVTGRWFFPGTPVSSTNKTDHHNITEILLKVALNTKKTKPNQLL